MRLKLKESPVFQAMKEAGKTARNPLQGELHAAGSSSKMILVALFGIAAGLTVIWYTAQFQALYFLQNALRIDDTAARLMIGVAALFSACSGSSCSAGCPTRSAARRRSSSAMR